MKLSTLNTITVQEVRLAFLYHYSRCGIDAQTAGDHWVQADVDPTGIVLFTELESGTLRAFYKINPDITDQTIPDTKPIVVQVLGMDEDGAAEEQLGYSG